MHARVWLALALATRALALSTLTRAWPPDVRWNATGASASAARNEAALARFFSRAIGRRLAELAAASSSGGAREAPFVLNRDFDMSRAFSAVPRLGNGLRLDTMLHILFERVSPQLVENKLLLAGILQRAQIPTPPILHGSFFERSLGPFPQYSRKMLRARIHKLVEHGHYDWVLKPATGALGQGVLTMNRLKWHRGRWTPERVADFAHGFFTFPSIKRYEHRGVLVQGRYDLVQGSEYKVHVILGEPHKAEAWAQVNQYKMVELVNEKARNDGRTGCHPKDEPNCEMYKRALFDSHWEPIAALARRVARLFGMPWFRLDVFVGDPLRGLMVNEVTFPSHAIVCNVVLDALHAAMRPDASGALPYPAVNASRFVRRALRSLSIEERDFLTPDRCVLEPAGPGEQLGERRVCREWDLPKWRAWLLQHINETVVRYWDTVPEKVARGEKVGKDAAAADAELDAHGRLRDAEGARE